MSNTSFPEQFATPHYTGMVVIDVPAMAEYFGVDFLTLCEHSLVGSRLDGVPKPLKRVMTVENVEELISDISK